MFYIVFVKLLPAAGKLFEFDRTLYERLGAELFNRVDVLSFARTAREIFIRHGGLKGILHTRMIFSADIPRSFSTAAAYSALALV